MTLVSHWYSDLGVPKWAGGEFVRAVADDAEPTTAPGEFTRSMGGAGPDHRSFLVAIVAWLRQGQNECME